MRGLARILVTFACVVFVHSTAFAQASITGVVRDTSGAVLPGVTVEASSPALIEKIRSVITDGTGQYRIPDLRPGPYTVVFTLPGFATIRREGIELTGSFVASVNVELRVGGLEETITVTGESPLVDVQTTARQRVLDREVIDAVPAGRLPQQLAVLLPGVSNGQGLSQTGTGGPQDVGGTSGNPVTLMVAHGSRAFDQRITLDGLSLNLSAGVNNTLYTPNMAATQEVTIDISGSSAESAEGGVRINLIPRDGGNTYTGSAFFDFANESMSNSNLTDDLEARGFTNPNAIKKVLNFNPSFGGPIKRDTLWFYSSYRRQIAQNWAGGVYFDTTWNDPNVWTLNMDPNHRISNDGVWDSGEVRLTWQATPKNKFAGSFATERQCKCPSAIRATTLPGLDGKWGWPHHMETFTWTSPVTNRLLLEAGMFYQYNRWDIARLEGTHPDVIGVLEQSTQVNYKLRPNGYADHWQHDMRFRGAASYVTGAHALKVGFSNALGDLDTLWTVNQNTNVYYRFNRGTPNQITQWATPFHDRWELDSEFGLYAQDRWTLDRLTLNGGVRFDSYKSHFPGQTYGPVQLAPNRNFSLDDQRDANWKDLTPRMGASYDVFGNGKTAVKASFNKYIVGQDGPTFISATSVFANVVTSTTRTWSDTRFGPGDPRTGNVVPDCNLLDPATNGECDGLTDTNFGNSRISTNRDPEVLNGWGVRAYNWEFSAGVQHEILPRVAVDVSYFRRWYGNFVVTDNRALTASDFDPFWITAPTNEQLPDGGGYLIDGLYNLNTTKFGVPADNFLTSSSNYGEQTEHWNGVDFTVSSRPREGMSFQGGVSTGRTTTDNCAVAEKLPETIATVSSATPFGYCRMQTLFLTHVKAAGSVTIPKIDIQLSGGFQSVPGPAVISTYNAPTAQVRQTLGRDLSGGSPNVGVNLITPGTTYGDRLNQLDLRFGKRLRFGRARAVVSLDLYNTLNSSAVLTESTAYATFRQPQIIVVPRFFKVSTQFDF